MKINLDEFLGMARLDELMHNKKEFIWIGYPHPEDIDELVIPDKKTRQRFIAMLRDYRNKIFQYRKNEDYRNAIIDKDMPKDEKTKDLDDYNNQILRFIDENLRSGDIIETEFYLRIIKRYNSIIENNSSEVIMQNYYKIALYTNKSQYIPKLHEEMVYFKNNIERKTYSIRVYYDENVKRFKFKYVDLKAQEIEQGKEVGKNKDKRLNALNGLDESEKSFIFQQGGVLNQIPIEDLEDVCISIDGQNYIIDDIYNIIFRNYLLNNSIPEEKYLELKTNLLEKNSEEDENDKKIEVIMKIPYEQVLEIAEESGLDTKSNCEYDDINENLDYIDITKLLLIGLTNYIKTLKTTLEDLKTTLSEETEEQIKISFESLIKIKTIIEKLNKNSAIANSLPNNKQYTKTRLLDLVNEFEDVFYDPTFKEYMVNIAKDGGISNWNKSKIEKMGLTPKDIEAIKDKISTEDLYMFYTKEIIGLEDLDEIIKKSNKEEEFKGLIDKKNIKNEIITPLIKTYEDIYQARLKIKQLEIQGEDNLPKEAKTKLEEAKKALNKLSSKKRNLIRLYNLFLKYKDEKFDWKEYLEECLRTDKEENENEEQNQEIISSLYEDRLINIETIQDLGEEYVLSILYKLTSDDVEIVIKNYGKAKIEELVLRILIEDNLNEDQKFAILIKLSGKNSDILELLPENEGANDNLQEELINRWNLFNTLDKDAIIKRTANNYFIVNSFRIPYMVIVPYNSNNQEEKQRIGKEIFFVEKEEYEKDIANCIGYDRKGRVCINTKWLREKTTKGDRVDIVKTTERLLEKFGYKGDKNYPNYKKAVESFLNLWEIEQ